MSKQETSSKRLADRLHNGLSDYLEPYLRSAALSSIVQKPRTEENLMAKKNSYLISLRNCRNIVETETDSICIENNSLNVFYGKNGTGKTSLISALRYLAKNDNTPLSALESFDFKRTGDQSLAPEVKCSRQIKEILVFDEKWIADTALKKAVSTKMHLNSTLETMKLESSKSKETESYPTSRPYWPPLKPNHSKAH